MTERIKQETTPPMQSEFAIVTLGHDADGVHVHVESATDHSLSRGLAEDHFDGIPDAMERIRTRALLERGIGRVSFRLAETSSAPPPPST